MVTHLLTTEVLRNMPGVIEDYSSLFATIGVLSLSFIALRVLYTIWRGFKSYLLSNLIDLGVDVKSLGEWAGIQDEPWSLVKCGIAECGR